MAAPSCIRYTINIVSQEHYVKRDSSAMVWHNPVAIPSELIYIEENNDPRSYSGWDWASVSPTARVALLVMLGLVS